MSSAFLFYFHVVVTGGAIAAAAYYLAAMLGTPVLKPYPTIGEEDSLAGHLTLWLLAGPVALVRSRLGRNACEQPMSGRTVLAVLAAFIWAFCLGVLALELVFRLLVA